MTFTSVDSLLKLEVFDFDHFGAHDSLGTVEISLKDLVPGIEKSFWVKLEGGNTGENIVATVGNFFKRKKSPTTNINKGQIKLGITAIDFGFGYVDNNQTGQDRNKFIFTIFNINSFNYQNLLPLH